MKKQLRKSDIRELNDEVKSFYKYEEHISPRSRVELVDNEIYLVDNVPHWIRKAGRLIPTVRLLLDFNFLHSIVVDMGAVRFVTGGADVMRPGIVEVHPDIKKDEVVAVVDEKHKKPLAVGITVFDADGIKEQEKGKCVMIHHYVGDRVWDL